MNLRGGSSSGGRRWRVGGGVGILLIVAALVAAVGWRTWYRVGPGEVAFVQGFGPAGPALVTEPGVHFKAPWQAVRRVDRRLRLLTFEPAERLLADQEPVVIEPFACWRVAPEGLDRYLRVVSDARTAERRLREIVWSALDGELAAAGLREWLNAAGDAGPVPAPADALLNRVRRTARAEAQSTLGIDLADVGVRRLTRPERMKEQLLALMLADRERAADAVRQETRVQVAQVEAAARRDAELLLAEAQRQTAAIARRGWQEAEQILAEARKLNAELTEQALRAHAGGGPQPAP